MRTKEEAFDKLCEYMAHSECTSDCPMGKAGHCGMDGVYDCSSKQDWEKFLIEEEIEIPSKKKYKIIRDFIMAVFIVIGVLMTIIVFLNGLRF